MSEKEKEFVLLSRYFSPNSAATGRLMRDLATGLENRGLDISVYTASGEQPNDHHCPEIRVRTSPSINSVSESTIVTFLDWLIFTLWVFFALVSDRPKGERELIVVSTPPTLPIIAWMSAQLRGWEYTYVVFDVWPEAGIKGEYVPYVGPLFKIWSRIHIKVLSSANNIVTLGPAMVDQIIESSGGAVTRGDITVIHNWEDPDHIQPISKQENPFSEELDVRDQFTLVYSGNINPSHDLETIVHAASRFIDDDVKFIVIGQGVSKESIEKLARELDLDEDTISFLPYQPYEDIPYTLTSGDVIIITKRERVGISVSCKVYTALATGQPILCIAETNSDESRIINESDVGAQVEPGDVQGVIEAIEDWKSNPSMIQDQGRRSRLMFENNFTKAQSIDQYFELLVNSS